MLRCPYCKAEMKKNPAYLPLSPRGRRVFDVLIDAGPSGIKIDKLKDKCFPKSKNTGTLRTTIHYTNKKLTEYHMVIKTQGGIVRLGI